jgi:ABC-type lipoprotein export system ATPase subunit
MVIKLQKIVPGVMRNMQTSPQSIWRNTIEFKSSTKNIINASSGKGKTSFTKILSGILSDFEGELYFDQRNVKKFTLTDWTFLRKKEIATVYQDLQVFPNLTVHENFKIVEDLYSMPSKSEMAYEFALHLGIEEKWNVLCKNLSMGQQQRVAIIRALIRPFKWLILDEPFSHLDHNNAVLAMEIIQKRVKELNAGFILTSLDEVSWIEHDTVFEL